MIIEKEYEVLTVAAIEVVDKLAVETFLLA